MKSISFNRIIEEIALNMSKGLFAYVIYTKTSSFLISILSYFLVSFPATLFAVLILITSYDFNTLLDIVKNNDTETLGKIINIPLAVVIFTFSIVLFAFL